MITNTTIFVKKARLPWRVIEEHAIIVDLDREKVIDLGGVAKDIWDSIDGNTSIDDMTARVTGAYDVSREDALQDILEFTGQLLGRGLIHEKLP